jgi:hypothetical protein
MRPDAVPLERGGEEAARARRAGGEPSGPTVTRVERWATMMPAFWRPMKAMKSPMPAEIAAFCSRGMASRMRRRIPVTDSRRNRKPLRNTIPRAAGQGI